jgi:hypothetical protein
VTNRGKNKTHPENVLTHEEAARFMAEVNEWLLTTGSVWSHLARSAGVSINLPNSVREKKHGMLRVTQAALAAEIARHPQGMPASRAAQQPVRYLGASEAQALGALVKAWLERTGTPAWRIGSAVGRNDVAIERLTSGQATRVSVRVAARLNQLMEQHPEGMDASRTKASIALPQSDVPPPPLVDPLAERRGEAERRHAAWVAQQEAEHQRKYGRPLGRRIREMVV